MSQAGNQIGSNLIAGRTAAIAAFASAHKGEKTTAALIAMQQLQLAQSDGNVIGSAIDLAIQSALTQISSGEATMTIVAAVNLQAGQPVCVDLITGQLKLANATAIPTAAVIGLTQVNTLAGYAAPVATSLLELTDWTPIVGSIQLQRGQRYYLSTIPGQLTTIAPAAAGQVIVSMGIAVNFTQLEISVTNPILL